MADARGSEYMAFEVWKELGMIRMQSRSSREMMAGRSMQSSPYLRLLALRQALSVF